MTWFTELPSPPAHRLVGPRRHPRGVAPHLRGPEADSRDARRADGARRRRARRPVLPLALGPARNRQLADPQPRRLRRVRRHRAVSVRHPAGARASRPRAVLPLLREGGVGGGVDRRAHRGGQHAVDAAHRRDHRHRAADRAAELHRGRHSARRRADLRSAAEHLPAVVAAARRRGDRPGRSRGGGRVLPAADGQPEAEQGARIAPSRGDRADRGERRRGDCRVGGDRHISVVVDGQIERGLDPDALRARLRSLLLQRRAAAPRRDVGAPEMAGRV